MGWAFAVGILAIAVMGVGLAASAAASSQRRSREMWAAAEELEWPTEMPRITLVELALWQLGRQADKIEWWPEGSLDHDRKEGQE